MEELDNNITLEDIKNYKTIVSQVVNNLEIIDNGKLMNKILISASEDKRYKENLNFYVDLMKKCYNLIDVAEDVNDSYKKYKRHLSFDDESKNKISDRYSYTINKIKEIKKSAIEQYNNILTNMNIPLEISTGVTKTDVTFNLILAQLVKSKIRRRYRHDYDMKSRFDCFGIHHNPNIEVENILYKQLKYNEFNDEELHQLYSKSSVILPETYKNVCYMYTLYKINFYSLLQSSQYINNLLNNILKEGKVPNQNSDIMKEISNYLETLKVNIDDFYKEKEELEDKLEISTEVLNLCADKILGPRAKKVSLKNSEQKDK